MMLRVPACYRWVLFGVGCAAASLIPVLISSTSPPPPRPLVGILTAFALIGVGLGPRAWLGRRYRTRFARAVLLVLVCSIIAALAHLMLLPLALRQPLIPGFSHLVAAMLTPAADVAVTAQGEWAIHSGEGLLLFAPTVDKVGVLTIGPVLMVGLVLLCLARARVQAYLMLGLSIVTLAAARAAWNTLRFAEIPNVLALTGAARTEIFQRPHETAVWILTGAAFAGMFLGRWRKAWFTRPRATPRAAPLTRGAGVAALVACFAGSFLLATSAFSHRVGEVKAGRVLVDDILSGIWAPAARRLDGEWFGDFSTYGYSSLVEFLGYYFHTDVNVGRRYDDELLSSYDVLMIKTPAEDLSAAEEDAIARFVERGGGLFLIGDHTNLMGTSLRINRLSEQADMRLRFDSVMDARHGGFSRYSPPWVLAHPAARRVGTMEFMTSCSIATGPRARPVMIVHGQVRQAHDWSHSSFFGSLRSDPRMDHGSLVVAAEGTFGRGRMLLFSDSTIFSSFALFLWDRERFLLDSIAFLNTTSVPAGPRSILLLVLGGACIVHGLIVTRNSKGIVWPCSCAIAIAVGVSTGAIAADRSIDRLFPEPIPTQVPPRLAIWWGDTEANFPPVLGTTPEWMLDNAYDTLLAAMPRSGVFPLPTRSWDDALQAKGILVLNPHLGPSEEQAKEVEAFVYSGGSLIVATRRDHVHLHELQAWLAPFGVELALQRSARGGFAVGGAEPVDLGSPRISAFAAIHGAGRVIFLSGSEWWVRKRLGHAFAIPGETARADYGALDRLLVDQAGLGRRVRRTHGIVE